MGEDLGEKTEQPTTRRLEQARQRGQVAQSRDLAGAIVLLGAVMGFHFFGERMVRDAVRLMIAYSDNPVLAVVAVRNVAHPSRHAQPRCPLADHDRHACPVEHVSEP